jgi:hypothetical protein
MGGRGGGYGGGGGGEYTSSNVNGFGSGGLVVLTYTMANVVTGSTSNMFLLF